MRLFTPKFLYILLLCLPAFSVKAQLVAGFTASPTSGCAPLVVCFTNTTTPTTGTTYDWNLDNGSAIIHLTDPCGSYLTAGTYTVTLTAHNGSSTSTHTAVITVYPSPVVNFTVNDTTICPGTSVTFTSTTVGGVPGPVTYSWAYGDGFGGTGSPSTHTYTSPGYRNVTLTATNADGCVASLTKTAYVDVYTPPIASFSAPITHFCRAPGIANFIAAPTGTAPFSYTWFFGDGSPTSSLSNPSHTYSAPGSYTVKLIVTDAHGCIDSITMTGYIVVGSLHASFTYPTTACVNTVVTFPNTSSAHVSASWDYGDTHTSTTETGSNVFTVAGTYNVRLIIFDGFCYDTVYHSIVILPGASGSFTITPAEPCPAPATATFTATLPAGCTVLWQYGDGATGAGYTSSHTYGANGCDTVQMIVTNASGCIDTFTQTYCIYDLIYFVSRGIDTAGCAPFTVLFNSFAQTSVPGPSVAPYPYPISSYTWNFGDGSPTSTAPMPAHTYTAAGTYFVTVNIVTANGCTATATITILVGNPPVVTFTGSPLHLCYHNNNVSFVSTIITGPVDDYLWQYGDGGSDHGLFPTINHHFTIPGLFSVTLTPSYHGCPGPPVVLTNYVLIDSPMSIIHDSVLCSPAKRVYFGDSSLGDDTHLWIFGDGSANSTANNPIHDYPLPISYTATLTTYNIASGCRDTTSRAIDLHRPVVTFTTPDTAVCRDSFVLFTSSVTGGIALSYLWHSFGHSADSTSSTYLDTFHIPGIYSIRLIISDQNYCLDTAIRTNYLLVAKPVATFSVAPPSGCWPLTAVFTDHATDVAGTFFTNYIWNFGDTYTSTGPSPTVTHLYTTVGTMTITEIVTDNIGCKDTIALPLVTIYKPTAAFSASTIHPCLNDNVTFTNTSSTTASSFWTFGDGGTSTVTNPVHAYTATGTYTVRLVATDTHGCHDTLTRTSYIIVTQPHASFYMDDSTSICPPLTVHFTNTSVGALFYSWKLGDGSSSTTMNPTNLYITTGYDTVRLIVSNTWGCKDTTYGHVSIFGYAGAFSYTPDSGCVPLTVHFSATISNVPNIIWDFSDGYTSSASMVDTISHTYLNPGAYLPKLILSDNTGCQNSSKGIDTIKVDGVFPGFTTKPNPVCLGESINLLDTSSSYWSTVVSWSWTYNGTTSNLPSPSVTYTAVGTYPVTVIATDGWGCTAVATHDVAVFLPPVITISPDTIICLGDAATLYGYGGVSYTWAGPGSLSCTNCNPTQVTPIVVSQYTVTGTDIHGCTNTDTTTVFLKTLTVSRAWGDTAMCFGKIVPLYDSGGTKYTWLPPLGLNNSHIADPLASPPYSLTYMAIAQLGSCIPDTNYVSVIVYPLPTVDAGPDQTLLAGSQAQLDAKGTLIYKYLWAPGNTLNCDTCANPVASMSVSTTYVVTVTSIHGCLNDDSVRVILFCDNSQLFIPNSFTPNGDGQNDVFYPRGQGVSIIKSFRIYNRWGQMLFERSNISLNDASNAWDGSYNGGSPRPDVYVWVIDAICETGEPLFLKGDITIIR